MRLENLVLTGGWAETGGGLLVTAAAGGTADVAVVNTVVAMNDASRGGGIAVQADGAQGARAELRLLNSTVGWNDAGEGGGIFAAGVNAGAVTVEAANQIVWGNRSATGEDVHIVQDGGTVPGSAAFSDIGGVSFGGDD